MSRFFVGPSLSVYQVEEVEVIGGINVRRVCVGSNRQVMSAPGTTRDPDPFKGHCPHSGMVTFAALALGEQFIEFRLSEHAAQGCLRNERSRFQVFLQTAAAGSMTRK